ncbi:2Fe-2S iron-sulfur cluster-binding protein [Rhodanobacter soli]
MQTDEMCDYPRGVVPGVSVMSVSASSKRVAVTVACSGESYACSRDESLLRGMLRLGRKGIPVGCTNGGCGVCKVRVTSGRVRQLGAISRAHVSVEEEAAGYALACRVAPETDVILEVAGKLHRNLTRTAAGRIEMQAPTRNNHGRNER